LNWRGASATKASRRADVKRPANRLAAEKLHEQLDDTERILLESTDQLREDKFYRFNQTRQELLNLASKVPA